MAIDFEIPAEDQVAEETGPVKERPLHENDPDVDDDGFEDIENAEALFAAFAEPADGEVFDDEDDDEEVED